MAITQKEIKWINNETREKDLKIPENERVPFNANEINQEWNELERNILALRERLEGQQREINEIINRL